MAYRLVRVKLAFNQAVEAPLTVANPACLNACSISGYTAGSSTVTGICPHTFTGFFSQ